MELWKCYCWSPGHHSLLLVRRCFVPCYCRLSVTSCRVIVDSHLRSILLSTLCIVLCYRRLPGTPCLVLMNSQARRTLLVSTPMRIIPLWSTPRCSKLGVVIWQVLNFSWWILPRYRRLPNPSHLMVAKSQVLFLSCTFKIFGGASLTTAIGPLKNDFNKTPNHKPLPILSFSPARNLENKIKLS